MTHRRKRLAILGSGSGTNAEVIMKHFADHPDAIVAVVISNAPSAGILRKAADNNVPSEIITRDEIGSEGCLTRLLDSHEIDMVILAGFLWLLPPDMVRAYEGRIINIHPSLLPKYGGRGMYGRKVHEAVIAAGEKESGITIHRVNEYYDEGEVIWQSRCPIHPGDTPEAVEARIRELEHRFYPQVIEKIVKELPVSSPAKDRPI